MYDSVGKLQKTKLQVEMELDDGAVLRGCVFVGQRQRLPDLMNDDRQFLPFETTEGLITIVRKQVVRRVTPLNQMPEQPNNTDPSDILGVPPDATYEEAREAYLRKVQEYHPDRLSAAGMPKEFIQMANERTARINDAFDRLKKARHWGDKNAPQWVPGGV
ncbi:MAG: J domain-containing protein [Dongiaceae bacterium]